MASKPKQKDLASVLFHPKKKNPAAQQASSKTPSTDTSRSSSPTKPRGPPRPRPKQESDDETPSLPDGPYAEFKLMSSALNGWKYDVMKLDSRKKVDIMEWAQPVKLNRKEPRRQEEGAVAAVPQAVGPMLGPDGKAVIGMDGKVVMVDAEGRPIRYGETRPASADKGKEKEKGRKKFQKKTRQVFLIPESVRQLRREERFPWVLEDASQKESWVAAMEEASKSETHALFMPAASDVFKFVPAHRWYKFHKKPSYRVPTLEEAESLMSRIQKNKDPERWLLRKRNGQAPSEETKATFKRAASAGANGSSLPSTAGQSLGPGGRRLKMVDNGSAGLFGEDDDDDGEARKRKARREFGAEGDLDELDFEEGFADDEEKMEPEDQDDDEAKELEERLKREYKTANKTREGYVDESDEDEDENNLTNAGKNLQKTLKKLEKDGGYDDSDDDERNPYASSDEEEEEEPPQVPTGPAIIAPEPKTRPPSQTPAPTSTSLTNGAKTPAAGPTIKTEPGLQSQSRATSPVPAAGHGGHSVVAKRATSPKVPKAKAGGVNRAASPLLGGAVSPASSRATSPVATEGAGAKASNKRKAIDDATPVSPTGATSTGAAPKLKKRKVPDVELEVGMVIQWLRDTPGATTRDCIHHFTPYLTDEAKKSRFTALVMEVAQLSKGVLVLRPAYREAGVAGGATV